jgi:hypothetical protein
VGRVPLEDGRLGIDQEDDKALLYQKVDGVYALKRQIELQ